MNRLLIIPMKLICRYLPALVALFTGSDAMAEENFVNPPYDAPKVSAPDQDGKVVNFSDVYQLGTTVVFFYPKAATPG
jgi:hypothetical protein